MFDVKFILFFVFLLGCQLLKGQRDNIVVVKVVSFNSQEPIFGIKLNIEDKDYQTNSDGIANVYLKNSIGFLKIYKGDSLIKTSRLFVYRDTSITIVIDEQYFEIEKFKLVGNKSFKELDNKISIPMNLIKTSVLPLSTNDPIHLLKMLPGVSTAQEMNSNINVRGASSYNTCIYLDNVPVPNLSHSFGLISFYDNNIIRHIDYFNNQISSAFGTRGSSYFKFFLKDPLLNKNKGEFIINPFFVTGNANLKMLENKFGLFVNYRKSILSEQYNASFPLFSNFQDVLVKSKFKIKENSHLSIFYMDSYDKSYNSYGFGLNVKDSVLSRFKTFSVVFNKMNKRGFSQTISGFIKSQFLSRTNNNFLDVTLNNKLDEYNVSYLNSKSLNKYFKFLFGFENQFHKSENKIDSFNFNNQKNNISSLFFDIEYKKNNYKVFANVRPNYFVSLNEIYFEARSGILRKFNNLGLYTEVNRYVNSIHSLSNNLFAIPEDYRFLPTKVFKPQTTNEILIGLKYSNLRINFSSNFYYRVYDNSYDYKKLYLSPINKLSNISKVDFNSYGIENFVSIKISKSNSMNLSYTYSKSTMYNDSINLGIKYVSNFDRPHILNAFYMFKYKRITFTTSFIFKSGRPYTAPLYVLNNIPFYSNRNEFRLPVFHKLDIGVLYEFKSKVSQTLQFHLYNVYSRNNIYAVVFNSSFSNPEFKYFSAFPFLPSFSYSIKF